MVYRQGLLEVSHPLLRSQIPIPILTRTFKNNQEHKWHQLGSKLLKALMYDVCTKVNQLHWDNVSKLMFALAQETCLTSSDWVVNNKYLIFSLLEHTCDG